MRGPALLFFVHVAALAVACGSLREASSDGAGGAADAGGADGDAAPTSSGTSGTSGASGTSGDGTGDGGLVPGDDPRFARWPVPADAPSPVSFVVTNGADGAIVTDPATGLAWQDAIPATEKTFADAKTYCEGLVYDGRTDWRLPTRIEAITIMAMPAARDGAAMVTSPFTVPASTPCAWTASEGRTQGTVFANTSASMAPVSTSSSEKCLARCVRSGPPIPSGPSTKAYVVETDVVRDPATGLIWERTPPETKGAFADAKARCAALTLGGRPGRLPTVKELSSLVDETRPQPNAASAAVLGVYVVKMFTANPNWLVDFDMGSTYLAATGFDEWSRCVASGP